MGKKAVFLDRDGTIIEDVDYLSRLEDIKWIKGAKTAIKDLFDAGFKIVVITNQSGVARGLFDQAFVHEVHRRLNQDLASLHASIHGFYFCPHHPEEGKPPFRMRCNCRKPGPGLVEQAKREFSIDLEASFFIGDNIVDVETAMNTGLKPILVLTGKGQNFSELVKQEKRYKGKVSVFPDLRAAADWIINVAKPSISGLHQKGEG